MRYASAREVVEAAPSMGAETGRPRILVVDDEILIRLTIADELRTCGYRVVEAAKADEAVAILRSDTGIDLVLTDVRMPGGMDGIGLARLIRDELPQIKLVVASAHLPASPIGTLADAFFSKPYDVGAVIGAIAGLLANGTERSSGTPH
jgi:two-component system, response regulator PdtaR